MIGICTSYEGRAIQGIKITDKNKDAGKTTPGWTVESTLVSGSLSPHLPSLEDCGKDDTITSIVDTMNIICERGCWQESSWMDRCTVHTYLLSYTLEDYGKDDTITSIEDTMKIMYAPILNADGCEPLFFDSGKICDPCRIDSGKICDRQLF